MSIMHEMKKRTLRSGLRVKSPQPVNELFKCLTLEKQKSYGTKTKTQPNAEDSELLCKSWRNTLIVRKEENYAML